jgi:hypothetical protein
LPDHNGAVDISFPEQHITLVFERFRFATVSGGEGREGRNEQQENEEICFQFHGKSLSPRMTFYHFHSI